MKVHQEVYVISDLHLGGEPPTQKQSRGFRMLTETASLAKFIRSIGAENGKSMPVELVINGDFVDFLEESVTPSGATGEPPSWSSFRAQPEVAESVLSEIEKHDKEVFSALTDFLDGQNKLTILLGNHDIELSLPTVRQSLYKILKVKPHHRIQFIFDGEAYVIGDALIEHGNRYDRFNQVDFDDLRHLRSLQSRGQYDPSRDLDLFRPPPGSELVVQVMNDIKKTYPFVDLLKPEMETVIPLLLVLEPEYAALIDTVLKLLAPAFYEYGIDPKDPARTLFLNNIASEGGGGIHRILSTVLPPERRAAFMRAVAVPEFKAAALPSSATPIAARPGTSRSWFADFQTWIAQARSRLTRLHGLATLSLASSLEPLQTRLPALYDALCVLQQDTSFDLHREPSNSPYLKAAQKLASSGRFKYIIFGHTHLAKEIELGNGCWYYNSGTWCDLLKIPVSIFQKSSEGIDAALKELHAQVLNLKHSLFSEWIVYRPTAVYLALDDNGCVCESRLIHWASPHS